MGRSPCCSKEGMNRGAWTALEDKILTDYIKAHGEGRWRNLPKKAGLKRCGKSCRLRWLNYLRPDIKRGNISKDEEDLIIRLHKLLGNRWSLIAGRLPGRTDNEIKNYWNTNLVKKVVQESHQNSSPDHDHSNHNHFSNDKNTNKPIVEPPPPPKNKPPSVHAKPLRCTKPITTNIINNDPVPENVHHLDGSSYNNGLSSLAAGEDDLPENFMMDLTMDDLLLSDLLNSESSDWCDFIYTKIDNPADDDDNIKKNNNNPTSSLPLSPHSSDQQAHLEFTNEMLEDWALCDQNVASNLISFSTFLDTEEGDWLRE